MEKKKIFIIAIVVILIIITIVFVSLGKRNSDELDKTEDVIEYEEDGTIVNNSKVLGQSIHFENIDIKKIEIKEKNATENSKDNYGQKVILTLKNNNNYETEETKFRMSFITKTGFLISQVTGTIPKMNSNEEKVIEITDLEQTIDYMEFGEIEIIKTE